MKINKKLFPVKMHYFFFMAAMGPILPFYPLVGKQLGLTEAALGSITAVFPLLYLVLKPFIGFLADYFYQWRKVLFVSFVVATCLSFNLLATIHDSVSTIPWSDVKIQCNNSKLEVIETCQMKCTNDISARVNKVNNGKIYFNLDSEGGWNFSAACCSNSSLEGYYDCYPAFNISGLKADLTCLNITCLLNCPSSQFSLSYNFWIFTVLTSLGSEGNDTKYGYQRVWGAAGFGLSALVGGYAVDWASRGLPYYNFIPVFILASACISLDVFFSWKLKLPELSKSENIVKDVWSLVKQPRIAFFLIFATFVGIMDSSIFFFLLWYIEDLATKSGSTSDIKFLQGLTVALETLGGETVSFFLSGWVLDKIGYAHSLSLGFLFYSVRLGLLASITEPWMALPIEGFLQGPSYALLYSTIVSYASSVTPPGTSGTVQGLVAGMDDGLGISVGSLIGGFVYTYYGGSILYTSYAIIALLCAIIHFAVYMLCFNHQTTKTSPESAKTYRLAKADVEMITFEKTNNGNIIS